MDRGFVKYNLHFLLYFKRKPIKITHKHVCIDGFLCCKAFKLIFSGFHAKEIKSCNLSFFVFIELW